MEFGSISYVRRTGSLPNANCAKLLKLWEDPPKGYTNILKEFITCPS